MDSYFINLENLIGFSERNFKFKCLFNFYSLLNNAGF